MTSVISTARPRSRLRRSWTRAVSAAGVATLLAAAVAACGTGSSASGSSGSGMKDGFTQAAQSSGPLTVWVDSTRAPAAQA